MKMEKYVRRADMDKFSSKEINKNSPALLIEYKGKKSQKALMKKGIPLFDKCGNIWSKKTAHKCLTKRY